ncbi:MAG: PD-(D/E)XK nuclease family protein [Chloroflexi bacterium]|nr:PD-(D/E)XK nuclease family protein [Chloroflexota bacterium]MBI3340804.1 PD-(D/E)XK nuclease family protein [Chloroflexota bacterium]
MTTKTQTQTGLAGFLCEVTEEPVTFQECLACAQRGAPGCPMMPAVLHDIMNSIRDPEYADNMAKQAGAEVGFSVTELIGCPRQHVLKKKNPYWEKPSSMYRMAFGSGYHAALAQYPSGIKEQTLTWKFTFLGKSVLLAGTPDFIEASPNGWHIVDYKETGNPPFGHKVPICVHCDLDVYKGDDGLMCPNCGALNPRSSAVARVYRPPQARSSHVSQVNLYALLIAKNAALLEQKHGAKASGFSGAEVVYLSPKTPVRCDVRLDRETTLALLKVRLTALLSPGLPPVLNEADELWRCDYCPVRAHCEQAQCGPVGKAAITEHEE